MLAQMGQMMQLRQMQQGFESENALSDSYRQAYAGGKFDPQAVIRGLVQSGQGHLVPKVEAQMLKAEQERANTRKTQVDTLGKEYENLRVGLTNITDETGYYDWVQSGFSNPATAAHLTQMGLTPEKALANARAIVAKEGLSTAIAKSAMGIGRFIEQDRQLQNSTRNAQIAASASNRNATVNEQRFALEKAEQENIARILRGEPPVPTGGAPVAPMTGGGGGGVAPMTGGGRAPMTAPMTGVAPVNALVPNAAPVAGGAPMPAAPVVQPNVNALNATPVAPNVNALTTNAVPPQIAQLQTQISQLLSSGSPKAIAAADALIKQHNLLMPTRQIVQNTKGEYNAVDQRTGASTPVLDDNGKPLVGKLPPEQFESSYKQFVGKAKGERDVTMVTSATSAAENLPKLYETLDQLKTSDAITGFGANIIKNIEAARAKFAGDIKAGKKVADTEILDAMLGSDVFPMIQSLGIGARGMDTPAEREYLRGVMTGTITMNKDALIKLTEIRKNIEERAITRYNQNVENGTLNKFFETEGRAPQKIDAPTYAPKTVTPQVGGGVRVTLPDGRSVMLPNAEAAAKFKKDAGIK